MILSASGFRSARYSPLVTSSWGTVGGSQLEIALRLAEVEVVRVGTRGARHKRKDPRHIRGAVKLVIGGPGEDQPIGRAREFDGGSRRRHHFAGGQDPRRVVAYRQACGADEIDAAQ